MTKDELKLALKHAKRDERHLSNAETRYWCEQYKLLATQAIEYLSQQEPDKNGSPCPEFWDWLPKAYNFEGNGAFTKYNMEVAFLAGKQSQPEQEPVAWPKTPSEISDMIGSSYVWREHKISDLEPHQNDKYCLTAHDLLEAVERWREYTTPPQRKPLTDEQREEIAKGWRGRNWTVGDIIDATEAAHGIKD